MMPKKLFQKAALSILIFFMSLMLFVTILAHTRRHSGVTGLDMGKIQQMRYEQSLKQ